MNQNKIWASVVLLGLFSLNFGCLDSVEKTRANAESPRTDMMIAASDASNDTDPDEASCTATLVYRHTGQALPGEVKLAGGFEVSPWSASIAMEGPTTSGEYVARLELPPGAYQYKFVVDGNWIVDAENELQEADGAGNANSVLRHRCPVTSDCVLNADCADALVCRNYECVACTCSQGFDCHPETKQCVEGGFCSANTDCNDGEVCRDERCAQCLINEECDGELVCLSRGCGEPECTEVSECLIDSESCSNFECVSLRCGEENFFLADDGNQYESVSVAGDFTDWMDAPLPMTRLSDGRWWVRTTLSDGAYGYKFIVREVNSTEERWISDPNATEQVPDGFGAQNSIRRVSCDGETGSLCGSPDTFDWRDAVMYFAMVDRFFDSDGMNIPVDGATDADARIGPSGQFEGGDLSGVTLKLDYLRDLGVNALWISAPYKNRDLRGAAINACENGGGEGCDPNYYSAYHGYWPAPDMIDYSQPDAPSPTPQVEPRIGTEAELRSMIDEAHDRDMKVLFDYVMNHIDIESGLYQAHPDWFASREDGSFFKCGESDFDGQLGWDHPYWGTRCVFTDYLPAFDFDVEAARRWSVLDAVWWAESFGIDGYRLDAIKHVSQAWLTELRDALDVIFPEPAGGRFYLVGETFDYFNKDILKAFVDPVEKLDGQFDFPLKKRLCEGVFHGQMRVLQEFMDGENRGFYGRDALMTTWIGNHDIPRAIHYASREIENCTEGSNLWNGWSWRPGQPQDAWPYERLALAFGVMFTTEGIPLIYYGDEIGLAGGGDPDNRRMMVWDDSTLSAAQLSLRERIRRLAEIRRDYKALSRGARQTLHVDDQTWVFTNSCQDPRFEEVFVAMNQSDEEKPLRGLPPTQFVDLLTGASVTTSSAIPPRSMLILKRNQE